MGAASWLGDPPMKKSWGISFRFKPPSHKRVGSCGRPSKLDDGELVEWSPFPLFPAYGKLVGKFSKKKNLKIYETRVNEGNIEINIAS